MLVAGGATNVTTYFALRLAADGTAATGLTITNFDLQYVRSGAAPAAKVDATALAATDSAHADNKAIEIDATDQPGLYRVDWPDAAFAAGVPEVILTVKCATCFTEHLRVEIDANVTAEALGTQAKADVNAEVVDVMETDTHAEVGQGAPPATATKLQMWQYLYKGWRNKKEQTATTESLYDDAGTTVDQKRTVSDDATTATKGEVVTGP